MISKNIVILHFLEYKYKFNFFKDLFLFLNFMNVCFQIIFSSRRFFFFSSDFSFIFNFIFYTIVYFFLSIFYSTFSGTSGSMNVPRTWKILAKENYLDEWVPLLDHNKVEHSRENTIFWILRERGKLFYFHFLRIISHLFFVFFLFFIFFEFFFILFFTFFFRIPLWKMYRGPLQNGRWPFPIRI